MEIINKEIVRRKKNDLSWNNFDWFKRVNEIDLDVCFDLEIILKWFKRIKLIEVKGFIVLCKVIDIDWKKVIDWKLLGIDEEEFVLNFWENIKFEDEDIFIGYVDSVGSIDFSLNEKIFVSGSYDGEIKIWDL